MTKRQVLSRRALCISQTPEHPLYVFSLTAKEVLEIAEISRVSRDEAGDLLGYQRPEVRTHIDDIVTYLDGDEVIFPNPIIMALTPTARFVRSRGPHVSDGHACVGTLEIPLPGEDAAKPAWIVDGQQRALALSKSKRADFSVPVNAFIADSVDVQREQFLRINNTRPLPRGLVTELLPAVSTPLSKRLSMRKTPSALCDLLNRDTDSPFCGLIHRPSSGSGTAPRGVITDTSVVNMLQESLTSTNGCLFPYRDPSTRETDFDGVWTSLLVYWTAVRDTFPDAWGKPAAKSRLMHGAGIRAMGRLMDRMLANANPRDPGTAVAVRSQLADLAPACSWTAGEWVELRLRWDEVQNVPSHINALSSFLIRTHARSQGALR